MLFGDGPGGVRDPHARGIRQHELESLVVLVIRVVEEVDLYGLRALSYREGEGTAFRCVILAGVGDAVPSRVVEGDGVQRAPV